MDSQEKTRIYDRLLAINIEISTGVIPDPSYINRKIGECHIHIGEVEKFYINVSKEISVIQRAMNNIKAKYDSDKEKLLLADDIKTLPSIADREAKANTFLKEELKEIQGHENELVDLNNLSKAINLKLRNLARTNGDIKSMLKMVEAQIRLGSPSDPVAKGFMEEMKKGIAGEDSFKEALTEAEENKTADPTVPLDLEDLLIGDAQAAEEQEAEEDAADDREDEGFNNLPGSAVSDETNSESEVGNNLPEDLVKEAEESILKDTVVDLELALNPEPQLKEGGEKAKEEEKKEEPVKEAPVAAKTDEAESPKPKNPDVGNVNVDGKINLDDLLKQYT